MKRIVLASLFLLAGGHGAAALAQGAPPAPPAAPTQEPPAEERRRDIRRLLQTMGVGELSVQILKHLMPEMRGLLGELLRDHTEAQRQAAVRIMEEEMLRTFTADRLVEEVIPIYEKHLTGEEIKALLAFFETPTGRKYLAVQPQLVRESMGLADKFSEEAYAQIEVRLRAEGITVAPRPQPPRRRRGRGRT